MSTPQLNASSRIMYQEAQRLGIECFTFGDHETILMKKDQHEWFVRGSRTSLQSSVGKTIADYKPLTKKILEFYHLPTAHGIVASPREDSSALATLQFPVVMKPLSDRHGKGVIVGIQTQSAAQVLLQQQTESVLLEEQLVGQEFRVVCVDYHFVAAAFRKPAHVVGDGQHSILQLIKQKNTHPWRGRGHENNLSFIQVDELVEQYLQEQGFSLQDVPVADQEVMLRKTANLSTGGEAWDVTNQVCAENQQLFEQIARACDLNTVGIDIMCQTLETPITTQHQAGVIEVNASPGLRMHHFPMQGLAHNVAYQILKMVATYKGFQLDAK